MMRGKYIKKKNLNVNLLYMIICVSLLLIGQHYICNGYISICVFVRKIQYFDHVFGLLNFIILESWKLLYIIWVKKLISSFLKQMIKELPFFVLLLSCVLCRLLLHRHRLIKISLRFMVFSRIIK